MTTLRMDYIDDATYLTQGTRPSETVVMTGANLTKVPVLDARGKPAPYFDDLARLDGTGSDIFAIKLTPITPAQIGLDEAAASNRHIVEMNNTVGGGCEHYWLAFEDGKLIAAFIKPTDDDRDRRCQAASAKVAHAAATEFARAFYTCTSTGELAGVMEAIPQTFKGVTYRYG